MTRVSPDVGDLMQKEALKVVSSDVNFADGRFPDYKIGSDNVIVVTEKNIHEVVPLKEIVEKETAQLVVQQTRLSVRDLRARFEKGLSNAGDHRARFEKSPSNAGDLRESFEKIPSKAGKLSDEVKRREATSLDRQVLLKKLRDVLDSLKGRLVGRNKEDVAEAISLVEALAVQLTQKEGELFHEKTEVKKLAELLKQATEDAKKVVEEEKILALAEIEKAKAVIQRIERALQDHESASSNKKEEGLDDLMKEIREARRIKMLHQPSRVMDMECELRALRGLVAEKSLLCSQLEKELVMIKRHVEDQSRLLVLEGSESLGSCLSIVPLADNAPDISNCSIQWYRTMNEGGAKELISGATNIVYAPEPLDVGKSLQAELALANERVTVSTAGPINPAAGLESFVEALFKRVDTEFNVIVSKMNGHDYHSNAVHVLHVGKLRMKLRKGRTTKARESYSSSMQLCGVRGGGNAAARAVFWQAKKGLSFALVFETDRERNAAIMLARKHAPNCNAMLVGPGDQGAT